MAKAKFLEGNNYELIALAIKTLSGEEVNDKAVKKVQKILDELLERTQDPSAPLNILAAISQATGILADIHTAYNAEIEAAAEVEPSQPVEDTVEESEEEAPAPKKDKKSKKDKKKKKKEEQEEAPADDEAANPYEGMTKKELKALLKERGFKVSKGVSAADMIMILSESDDEE